MCPCGDGKMLDQSVSSSCWLQPPYDGRSPTSEAVEETGKGEYELRRNSFWPGISEISGTSVSSEHESRGEGELGGKEHSKRRSEDCHDGFRGIDAGDMSIAGTTDSESVSSMSYSEGVWVSEEGSPIQRIYAVVLEPYPRGRNEWLCDFCGLECFCWSLID